jgi:hypothetical protein
MEFHRRNHENRAAGTLEPQRFSRKPAVFFSSSDIFDNYYQF